MASKPQIKQKTTWTGIALFGWGIYSLIFGNTTEAVTAITAGLGLIFGSDN
jgi:hypothetical protein